MGRSAQKPGCRTGMPSGAARQHPAQGIILDDVMMEEGGQSMEADQEISDRSGCLMPLLYLPRQGLVLADQSGSSRPKNGIGLPDALRMIHPAIGIASMKA